MIRCKELSFVLFLVGTMGMISCNSDDAVSEPNPPISIVPALEYLSVNQTSVQQLEENLQFILRYTDGDGDLGFENADSLSLWVTDQRADLVHQYHVPPLAPDQTEVTIRGELEVNIDNVILLDQQNSSEEAVFSFKIKDRAGQWSNEVSSPVITITQ